MPLEAVAIHSFDAPIMREPKHDHDLRDRIAKLYASNGTNTGGVSGIIETTTTGNLNLSDPDDAQTVMAMFERAFKRGALLYVGMFNDKPIAVVGCFDDGQTDTKRLQYLAVHSENINRGIDAKFIKLVYDKEVRKGVRRFMPVDVAIHQIMHDYELIEVKN